MKEVFTVQARSEGNFMFLDKAQADIFAQGKDEWGGSAFVSTSKVWDSAKEAETYITERHRKNALDKLSHEEKKALGLS